jgi:hypothetical protein
MNMLTTLLKTLLNILLSTLLSTISIIWGSLLLIIGIGSGLITSLLFYGFATGEWLASSRNKKSLLTVLKDPLYLVQIIIGPLMLIFSGVYGLISGNPIPLMISILIQYCTMKLDIQRFKREMIKMNKTKIHPNRN